MTNEMFPVDVQYSVQFKKDIKRLSKKYQSLKKDVDPIIKKIEAGENPGDRIPGVVDYYAYKERIQNSDNNKGKSGGYRLIYQIRESFFATLLTIYSKSEQPDISLNEILRLIRQHEEESLEE